jgi:hypothetical protein
MVFMVVHTYNLSYLRGWRQEDLGSRPTWAKVNEALYQKTSWAW